MVCTLYLTSACELCDTALAYLLESQILAGHVLETLDISEDDRLMERYAELIPVLRIEDSEFVWPFESAQLIARLQAK